MKISCLFLTVTLFSKNKITNGSFAGEPFQNMYRAIVSTNTHTHIEREEFSIMESDEYLGQIENLKNMHSKRPTVNSP